MTDTSSSTNPSATAAAEPAANAHRFPPLGRREFQYAALAAAALAVAVLIFALLRPDAEKALAPPFTDALDIKSPASAEQPVPGVDVTQMRELTDHAQRLDALEGRFAELNPRIDAYAKQLGTITEKIGTVREDGAAREKALEELRARVGQFQQATDAHDQRIAALEGQHRTEHAAQPPFRLTGLDRWGDVVYVVVEAKDGLATLRVGDRHDGWTLESLDAKAGAASFRRVKDGTVRRLQVP